MFLRNTPTASFFRISMKRNIFQKGITDRQGQARYIGRGLRLMNHEKYSDCVHTQLNQQFSFSLSYWVDIFFI